MPRVAAHSGSEGSVNGKDVPAAEASGGGEEEVGDASEYEIEQVLDAKRGVFPDVRALFISKFL